MKNYLIALLFIAVITACGHSNRERSSYGDGEAVVYEYEETITVEDKNTDWEVLGSVNSLCFQPFDWQICTDGDYLNPHGRFYELEEEGGYFLKPYTESCYVQYRYIDGEKQYRMNGSTGWVDFSRNPYSSLEYVVDNNNRPVMRSRDVENYTHYAEDSGFLYFIKMN